MMLALQILVVLGVGMVLYAVLGMFSNTGKKKKNGNLPLPPLGPVKGQTIQRSQNDLLQLKDELDKISTEHAQVKSALIVSKENETKLSDELRRRSEWVAKAEAELAKIKSEDSDLSAKFIAKEKELQEEFAKNVNFSRQLRELKSALETKEVACRLKEDQIQAQKHQIEEQLKSIKGHSATIDEFNRKEKVSEWVPKAEFNKLNEEYSQLEHDLEVAQERLKSFAEEIAQLRKEVKKEEKIEQAEEIKQAEELKQIEEPKPVEEVQQNNPQVSEENIEKTKASNQQKEEGS